MGKRAAIVAVVVLVAAVAVVGFRWGLIPGMASGTYYTQVDNTQIREQESDGGVIDFTGGMPLLYTLPSYDENGSVQDLSFGTERQLREGAYLRLSVLPVRGVTEWREVQYEELPSPVQARMRREGDTIIASASMPIAGVIALSGACAEWGRARLVRRSLIVR